MFINNLPLEIYDLFVGKDPDVYWGLLGIKNFALKLNSTSIHHYQAKFIENKEGCTWFRGKKHSFFNLPVVEYANGDKWWYQHDKLHRDNDLPAIVDANGDKWWYQHDKLHRDNDLPAIECVNGEKCWYQYGSRHRNNDLPAVERANGDKWWYNMENFIEIMIYLL